VKEISRVWASEKISSLEVLLGGPTEFTNELREVFYLKKDTVK
jgi:hypothetical protein